MSIEKKVAVPASEFLKFSPPAAAGQLPVTYPVATCQLSASGELVQANSAFYQLTGITDGNSGKGSFMQTYVHPLDYPLLNRKFLLAASTGKTYEAHVRLLRNNRQEEYQMLHLKMQARPAGQLIDIEAAPQAAEPSFYRGIDQLSSPVLLYDERFNLLKVNAAFTNLLGYTLAELEALNPITLIQPDCLPQFSRYMRQTISKEIRGFELELQLRSKTDSTVWVHFSATRVNTPAEEYILAVLQNISTLKHQHHQALRESQEMRNLVEKTANELKNPIRSLLALHHIAEMEYSQDAQAMEYFNHYHSSLTQLSKVVDDLLTLNHLSAKARPAKPVNVHTMVQNCLQNLSSLSGFYKIDFDIQVEVPEPLKLEERLIATILHNLVENAVRYANTHETPKVRIGIWQRHNQLTLEIADNGQGIAEDLQNDVFNMYVKGNTDSPGAGLGLFIVKSAVEKMQGTIRLRSRTRHGTWFKIVIPLNQ